MPQEEMHILPVYIHKKQCASHILIGASINPGAHALLRVQFDHLQLVVPAAGFVVVVAAAGTDYLRYLPPQVGSGRLTGG